MPRCDTEFSFDLCYYGSDYTVSGEFSACVRNQQVEDVWITYLILVDCDGETLFESKGERHNYEAKTLEGFVYDYARHLILRHMSDEIIEGAK